MRPAIAVVLHDIGYIYTTDKDFGMHLDEYEEAFTFEGDELVALARLFGVAVSEDTGIWQTSRVQAEDIEFNIYRGTPVKEVVAGLKAQVDGPNLIKFQVRWDESLADWDEITHSGRFTVHWGEWESLSNPNTT